MEFPPSLFSPSRNEISSWLLYWRNFIFSSVFVYLFVCLFACLFCVCFVPFPNLSFKITIEWSERYPGNISVFSKCHIKWSDKRKKNLIYLALKELFFAMSYV